MTKPMSIVLPILFIAILAAGCIPNAVTDSTETATLSPASPTAVVTSTSTATPLPPSPAPTESPTPTSTPDTRLRQQCLEIAAALPADVTVEGLVVMSGEIWLNPSYLLEVMSGRQIILPEKTDDVIRSMHVSPDRQRLAHVQDSFHPISSLLVITGIDGQPLLTILWEDSWRQVAGWFDNERLWISRKRGESENDALILLNPFTGKQEALPADFPDNTGWIHPGPRWRWFNASATIYDPTLSRVLYPSGFAKLILWDVQANTEIAVVTRTSSVNVPPKWSPDGQRFLISGPSALNTSQPLTAADADRQELFSVSREGEVRRLTYLTDIYDEVRFGDYAWSPDGRYVALSLVADPNAYPDLYPTTGFIYGRLAVLDIVTGEVTDYCVPNRTLAPPVWSPDGRQVVFEHNGAGRENDVYLIDLSQNFAMKIAEDVSPVGWMTAAP